jgi:hypothetical protein
MKKYLTLFAAFAAISTAQAQTNGDKSDTDQAGTDLPKGGLDSGSGTGIGIAIPQVSVKSEVAGESIKLTLGRASESFKQAAVQSLTVSATAPFNKDRGEGFLLTDAGLPTTVSAEVSYSWSFLPGFDELNARLFKPSEQADRAIRERCNIKYRADGNLENQTVDKCNKNLSDIVEDLKKIDKVGDMIGGKTIDEQSANEMNRLDKAATDIYDISIRYQRSVEMSSLSYHALSLTGSVGGDRYKFRDPTTLGELSRKQTLFSFGGAYSYIPNISRPWGYFFGGEYRRKYKLPDAETRCPPQTVGASSTTCFSSAFGPPKRNTDATTFAAIRYDASVGKKETPFAFELKLAYDAEDNEWGASLPVYFLQNEKGKLNGGIKVSWDSENDDVMFGFFIGTTFDFLKI